MSIASRTRNTKRPTECAKRQPRPYLHIIPSRFSLAMPRDRKTTGAFGGRNAFNKNNPR